MTRALRWIGLGLAGLVLLSVVLVGGGLLWLRSGFGHAWLTAELTRTLTDSDTQATVTGLGGSLPFHPRLARLDLADRDGIWLTVENAAVDLDATALLRGTARIDRISAGHILVARAPLPPTNPAPTTSSESFTLPHLPFALEVGALSAPAIELGPSLLGEPASFTLAGTASLHSGQAGATLSLVRLGSAQGNATVKLTLDDKQLDLDLQAVDRSGELLAQLDPAAGRQPLTLALTGRGPLQAWRGRLDGTAGGGSKLGADLTLGLDKGWAASIKGTAQVMALLPDPFKAAAGNAITFDIAAASPAGKPMTLDHADIQLAAGTIAAKGWFDPAQQTVDASATITGDIHALEDVAGEPTAGNFRLDLGLKGEMARPATMASATRPPNSIWSPAQTVCCISPAAAV